MQLPQHYGGDRGFGNLLIYPGAFSADAGTSRSALELYLLSFFASTHLLISPYAESRRAKNIQQLLSKATGI